MIYIERDSISKYTYIIGVFGYEICSLYVGTVKDMNSKNPNYKQESYL